MATIVYHCILYDKTMGQLLAAFVAKGSTNSQPCSILTVNLNHIFMKQKTKPHFGLDKENMTGWDLKAVDTIFFYYSK